MAAQENLEGFVESVFRSAWDLFKNDAVPFILAGVILVFVGGLTLGVLAGPLAVGFVLMVRKRMRGETISAGDIFGGMSYFLPSFLAVLIIGIGVIIGSILLVLPALILIYVTMFVFQHIAYKNEGVGSALGASFNLIKENFGPTIVLLLLVAVINSVGGAVPFGFVVTLPFGMIASTIAYEKLSGDS